MSRPLLMLPLLAVLFPLAGCNLAEELKAEKKTHFPILPSTVALWTFDEEIAGRFQDAGPYSFTLSASGRFSLMPSPSGSALSLGAGSGTLRTAYDEMLSPLKTGRMTLDARVRVEGYPAASTAGGVSHVAGIGNGINLEITHDGRLQTSFTQGNAGGSFVRRTYRSDSLMVPLGTWVDLAISVDAWPDSAFFYAYINGQPVALSARPGTFGLIQQEEDLTIGKNGSGGNAFAGLIDEIRISNTLVYGVGLPTRIDSTQSFAYGVTPQTVALWRFTAHDGQGRIPDVGPNGFHLTPNGSIPLVATQLDSVAEFDGTRKRYTAPYDGRFNVAPTGKITYEVRLRMTQYPSTANFKTRATVMGMYAGPALQIHSDGTITVKNQKLNGTTAYWYDTLSTLPNTVPLNEWVDVAIAVDANVSPKQVYAYINGNAVQLYGTASTNEFRIYTASSFAIGDDTSDNQPFRGQVESARVSNDLVLGVGLPILPKPSNVTFPR